jgi:hypothetical protein
MSSPECWAVFGEVLAKEYTEPALLGDVHQLTVDTYMAQHPVEQPLKSLIAHLVSLYTMIELGRDASVARAALVGSLKRASDFPSILPPSCLGRLTVIDVARASDASEHADVVRSWASEVWAAWSEHHGTITRLAG